MNSVKETGYAIGKSVLWFFPTLGVGLAQVWVMWLISLFVKTSFSYEKIFLDGIVLFFSIVLISSLVIDYFIFGEKETSQHPLFRLLFSILPIALIGISLVIFAVCYLKSEGQLEGKYFNIYPVIVIQWIILALTALYAITIKGFSFINQCKQCNLPSSTSITTP